MKIIIIIKNLWNGIRMLLLIIKIFNIEDFLSNLFNEIILNNIGDDTVSKEEIKEEIKEEVKEEIKGEVKAKEEYNKEIYKNSLMLKFIGAITFIC
jgi:hypothetical protein